MSETLSNDIGTEYFEKFIQNAETYYVDKTRFIKEAIETKQQTNKILSFLHNNIQTIIFAIFMVILCILFHIYHRNNIKTEWMNGYFLF